MSEKHGTEQIKKVLDVVAEAGNVAEKVAKQEGSAVAKMTHLVKMSDELLQLASLNLPALKAEVADLSAAEKAELLEHVKAKFDLADDELEAKLEAGLALAVKAAELVAEVVAFAKPAQPQTAVQGA